MEVWQWRKKAYKLLRGPNKATKRNGISPLLFQKKTDETRKMMMKAEKAKRNRRRNRKRGRKKKEEDEVRYE